MEFRAALAADKSADAAWKALPPSRKKEVLRYLASLESRETITRNIARATAVLSGRTARFIARDWKDGR